MLIGAPQLGVKRSVFVLRLQMPRRMSRCCRIDQVSKEMEKQKKEKKKQLAKKWNKMQA